MQTLDANATGEHLITVTPFTDGGPSERGTARCAPAMIDRMSPEMVRERTFGLPRKASRRR